MLILMCITSLPLMLLWSFWLSQVIIRFLGKAHRNHRHIGTCILICGQQSLYLKTSLAWYINFYCCTRNQPKTQWLKMTCYFSQFCKSGIQASGTAPRGMTCDYSLRHPQLTRLIWMGQEGFTHRSGASVLLYWSSPCGQLRLSHSMVV